MKEISKAETERISPENREGKEKLIREIENNARAEAENILKQARETAEQKVASAESRAQRLLKESEERAEARIEQIRQHTESTLRIRKKRIFLKQSEEIIGNIFERVKKEIASRVGSDEYGEVLKNWIIEAAVGLGTESAVVSVSPPEKDYLTPAYLESAGKRILDLTGVSVDIDVSDGREREPGVRALSKDGRLEYRNQVSTRLKRNDMNYRKLVRNKLEIEGIS